jgi:hypothetical protein
MSSAPAAVLGGRTFSALSDGGVLGSFTCAVATTGPTYWWGVNNYGQVGDGTNTERGTPTTVVGGQSFTRLTGGGEHNCGRAARWPIDCRYSTWSSVTPNDGTEKASGWEATRR